MQQAHVRRTLEQLHASVRERLNRAERSRSSPNNLIKHNPAFVGRVTELTALRNALTKNKLGVVGAREGQMQGRATVQGLGGMGKSELALAYAHAFAWDYPGGRWQIPCEHLSDLRVALMHLANANALRFEFTEDEKKNIALAFERVLRELNRCERCLLILDNVNDPNLLQPEYLDRLPRDGRVDLIATTRLAPRAIPGSAQEQSFIAVDELPEEDALALMRSHQPEGRFASQQEDDRARAIVRLLRGFTLAVETAAIYLGATPHRTPAGDSANGSRQICCGKARPPPPTPPWPCATECVRWKKRSRSRCKRSHRKRCTCWALHRSCQPTKSQCRGLRPSARKSFPCSRLKRPILIPGFAKPRNCSWVCAYSSQQEYWMMMDDCWWLGRID